MSLLQSALGKIDGTDAKPHQHWQKWLYSVICAVCTVQKLKAKQLCLARNAYVPSTVLPAMVLYICK